MTFMSTCLKKSEQWKEILGENIKLENEGDKMRAHAGEGPTSPTPLCQLLLQSDPTNRHIFHPQTPKISETGIWTLFHILI